MNTTIPKASKGLHTEWLTGIIGGLLLVSLGLELLARQVFGHTDVGTLLWALYVGFWSFILGATGVLLLAGQWLIEWRHIGRNKNTMNGLGGFSQPLSNSGAMTQTQRQADPYAQSCESATPVTCS